MDDGTILIGKYQETVGQYIVMSNEHVDQEKRRSRGENMNDDDDDDDDKQGMEENQTAKVLPSYPGVSWKCHTETKLIFCNIKDGGERNEGN